LKRLHAELGGQIKQNQTEAKRLAESMKHVEAALKMLAPGFNVATIAARRKNKSASPYKRGQVFRTVLVVMRESQNPLTSREISKRLLRKAGIAKPIAKQVRDMVGSVHSSLRNHQGKTISRVGGGMPARRCIADDAAAIPPRLEV
jgi:hypothetical protein